MLKRHAIVLVCVTAIAPACGETGSGGMKTSSSSHWAECETLSDCELVTGAVACKDGFCVDSSGARIPESAIGNGGGRGDAGPGPGRGGMAGQSGGQNGSGGAPPLGSGGIAAGGTATGGAANGGTVAGAGGTVDAGSVPDAGPSAEAGSCPPDIPEIGTDFRPYKACETDADCVIGEYWDCCGGLQIYGIHRNQVDYFERCVPDEEPVCDCAPQPTRTEDGRLTNMDQTNVESICIDNACTTRLTEPCGDQTGGCPPGQLCASFTDNIGPTSTTTHACAANPCLGFINCNCGQSVCEETQAQSYPQCTAGTVGTSGIDLRCDDGRQ